ncbi:MAG: CDP-glucose 4,6-dehydratase [Lachnospiraceae bacterium]|nr:CDP-glucose 4,6-dehydratase [Lachnospiraceae bacterium]
MKELAFFQGKKVLVTGHTGFKGAWLCQLLLMQGADVTGYALESPTDPALFKLLHLNQKMDSRIGDIRDYESILRTVEAKKPEIVIHLAAQPIVRESYKHPRLTYEINVMGTVNLLEAVRNTDTVKSVVNVTTDKVYKNKEWCWGYRETEELNGYDPYSNSKSCSELVTDSYTKAFLKEMGVAVSTARAGNVIGGGDFAKDRIIPDCIRAIQNNEKMVVRNPFSTRPYQHVLEALCAYLLIASKQYGDIKYSGNYNIGPDEFDCWETGRVVDTFYRMWNETAGEQRTWISGQEDGPHEANMLRLDCSLFKKSFGWKPVWHMEDALKSIVDWTYEYLKSGGCAKVVEKQITQFLSLQ